MISDDDLYRLAVFLGSAAMILIVIYHFVEVNTTDDESVQEKPIVAKPVAQTGLRQASIAKQQ
jgi:oligosaccharyl transferase complex subunit OST4